MRYFLLALVFALGCGSAQEAQTFNQTVEDPLVKSQLIQTWQGEVMGYSETLKIMYGGGFSSAYCLSVGQIRSIALDSGCPAGTATCGTAVIFTESGPGKPGCLPVKKEAICAFLTYGPYLTFNCGGESMTYWRD